MLTIRPPPPNRQQQSTGDAARSFPDLPNRAQRHFAPSWCNPTTPGGPRTRDLGVVHRIRRRLRLSQARFAELVGVAPNTVARWERGEMTMQRAMDHLVRLVVAQLEADRQRARARKRS